MSETTDRIKERLNIAEVVGEYVTLKQAGHHFKGLCPFHQEKSPSFIVSPERGIWHCFGCQEGGDVFSFVQRIEGLDFPGTLKLLAERAGVVLEPMAPRVRQAGDHTTRVYEALDATARFYREVLERHPAGQKAKEYLVSRGVDPSTNELFQLGYAPSSWQTIQRFLQRRGFTAEEMMAAGLVGKSQQRGTLYDVFRGRIIFPVHDVQGRVVAFGGRIVPWHATGNEGKYVNSPETIVYEKRRTIYNLNRAKQAIRQQGVGIVVEGYLDVVLLVQSGIENVVASSGTAFTQEHIQQLQRFTSTLHFAFDGDAAGLKAALSATEGAVQAGMRVGTITFPPGQDPADVAQKDPKMINEIVRSPRSLITVLLQALQSADTPTAREGIFRNILPFVASVKHPVQQGEMIQELAQQLHLPESRVIQELEKLPVRRASQSSAPSSTEPSNERSSKVSIEQRLLGLIIAEPSIREQTWPKLSEKLFLDESSRALYNQVGSIALKHSDFFGMVSQSVIAELPIEMQSLAEAVCLVAQGEMQFSSNLPLLEGQKLLNRLNRRALEVELRRLHEQLASGGGEQTNTLQQFQVVASELAKVLD